MDILNGGFPCQAFSIAGYQKGFDDDRGNLSRKRRPLPLGRGLKYIKMMKNHHLAKSIASASWSELFRQLKYKAEWNNKTFYQIDRFFPSSKTCNNCGYIKQDLTLDDRELECPNCHTKLDRDINASMNILQQGLNDLTNLGLGTKFKSKQKQVEALSLDESVKPEAPCFS